MRAVEALFASGTQWSQSPIESLPAAWAPRTYGAVIIAADVSAVAATNCRRESFLWDMAFPLCCARFLLVFAFLRPASHHMERRGGGDFVVRSEQNCLRLSRKHVGSIIEL